MARRREILVTGEIYHVFNKTIESKEVFSDKVAINLFLQLISYYKSTKSTLSFSKLKLIDNQIKEQILTLDKAVVSEVVPGMITEIKQYFGYLRDISQPRQLLPLPINVNKAGRNTLPSIMTIWQERKK